MKAGIALIGVAALLVACGESTSNADAHTGTEVAYAASGARAGASGEAPMATPAVLEEIEVNVPVEGDVIARNRAEITTRMMARVTELSVDVGARVRRGDVLVRLGTEDVQANREKAEAAVRVARVAREEAAKQARRMDTLFAQDVVAEVQRDQAHLHLTQAETQLAMAEATLREVETATSYAVIRAPFDGQVVSRIVDEGDVAAPGMPILVVEEEGPREGRLAVPVEAAEALSVGEAISVRTLGGRSAEAPVRGIAGGADPRSKTVEVRVTLPADWPTGVSLSALVPVGRTEALTVPASAVVRRGQLTGVRIASADGVTLRWVRLGRTVDGGNRVEVLSGLNPGDEIVR